MARWRLAISWLLTAISILVRAAPSQHVFEAALPDLLVTSIEELKQGLAEGLFTSRELVQAYKARINEVNNYTNAVIELNPFAEDEAARIDNDAHLLSLPLGGIPILVKDNVGQIGGIGINTTAGSYALLGSVPPDDSFIVKKLRQAGAIILGRANMCEWAHGRGDLTLGWSPRGGQTRSPFYEDGNTCGSSSGSGVASVLGLSAATIGTETGFSITCPSSRNSVVGIKPTMGLTSRHMVVPLLTRRDTVGPIARSVKDAAIILQSIAGKDEADPYTLEQPEPVPDYSANLKWDALEGTRIGMSCNTTNHDPIVRAHLRIASFMMEALGATVVNCTDLEEKELDALRNLETSFRTLSYHEVKADIDRYLALLDNAPRDLQDVVDFNNAHPELELPLNYSSQETFFNAARTDGLQNQTYLAANHSVYSFSQDHGFAALLNKHNVSAIVSTITGAYPVLPLTLAAIGGYPIVTVPLGFYATGTEAKQEGNGTYYPAQGMPFGLSFFGQKWSEQQLIGFAYAFEQATLVAGQVREHIIHHALPRSQLKSHVRRQKL